MAKVVAAAIGSTKARRAATHQNADPPAGAPATRRTTTETGAGGGAGVGAVAVLSFGPGLPPREGRAGTRPPRRAAAPKGGLQIFQPTFFPQGESGTRGFGFCRV